MRGVLQAAGTSPGESPLAINSHVRESSVDLLIRTGGERRLSDFLLWECAYAELVFVDAYWPDFDEPAFHAALAEFERRERRFGGLAADTRRRATRRGRGLRFAQLTGQRVLVLNVTSPLDPFRAALVHDRALLARP